MQPSAAEGTPVRILEANSPDGRLLGLDADQAAIARTRDRLRRVRRASDAASGELRGARRPSPLRRASQPADGILFDLGLSSYQLADDERAFSFRAERAARHALRHQPRHPGERARRRPRRAASWRGSFPHVRRGTASRAASPAPSSEQRRARADRDRRPAGRDRASAPSRASARPPSRASRDARLPGPAHRGQPGARGPAARAGGGGRPAAARWPAGRHRATTRSRTASSSASWPPSGAAASARRRCRSASAVGRRACAGRPQPGFPSDDEIAANPRARSARLRAAQRLAA